MAVGAGKYDDACTVARETTGGSVVLIVVDGNLGSGFSVQADPTVLRSLPGMLEMMAGVLRRDMHIPADVEEAERLDAAEQAELN